MGAAMNGIALHGGLKVYGATFFVFSDYLRPAIRLAALMKLPVMYVLTHDSIAVGEDGPTHEPIEQLASLRVIPDLTVIRPADGNETSEAWAYAIENGSKPVATRPDSSKPADSGRYSKKAREGICERRICGIRCSERQSADAQIIATGSEVQLAVAAQEALPPKASSSCYQLAKL